MLKKLVPLLLVLTVLLSLAMPAFADSPAESSETEASEQAEASSESSEAGSSSAEASFLTYEEALAQMTTTDYLVLFGGFFGSMAVAMVVYYFYMKRKRKKNVDKYLRP